MAKTRRYAPDAGLNKDRDPFYGSGNLSLAAALSAAVMLAACLGFGGAVMLSLVSGKNTDERLAKQDAKISALVRVNRTTSRTAIDQFCLLAERDHRQKVRNLRETYKFLIALRGDEKRSTLIQFVIANLPRTEKEAVTDQAPEICDLPGNGLPEPDPVLPRRPALEGFIPPVPPPAAGIRRVEPSSGPVGRPPGSPAPRPGRQPQSPQRPEGKPGTPSRPVSPPSGANPAPAAPPATPPRLTDPVTPPPVPPTPERPSVCVTVPPLLRPPICLP